MTILMGFLIKLILFFTQMRKKIWYQLGPSILTDSKHLLFLKQVRGSNI